ncbi:penicillin acylase family protein [Halorubrum lipolyticum]|uniref:Peptidase S45 penicillin amidase n=1 Tax=Halorubrum lipolyticum DSM 21995 TaxID=1227482 RepID=M0NMC2_9EURY|nr:penicillin acylase family protein [Halorubrum lipolyticum]EMA59082.1 peptidase S45 penicillin amidase [Halorubrum lipolyticum DSM 21995]
MTNDTTRRAVLAAALAAGTGGIAASSAADLLDSFAPLSGEAWDAADRSLPETVTSPHGDADVRVDGDGVPHVEAADEAAAYFAVGYLQAFDRLFAMDLQRRVMRGRLSEAVGESTVESDEFNLAMGFADAAEATWDLVRETPAGPLVEAFADGVNAAIEAEPLPLEFALVGHEPRPWTPVDSMLMEKQISWTLTGDFSALRRAVVVDRLGADRADELFPRRLDHDATILDGDETRLGGGSRRRVGGPDRRRVAASDPVDADLTAWLSGFESPTGVGSNSWVVSGEHTASGTPIVAYDPHLSLMAPPLWYEQGVETPERSVRGATFPGVPFVIAGANDRGTWSFTNVGADVLDCYRYETDEAGERYRYDGEWREFETETRTIPVSGGEDREIETKRTVHGPLIEREGRRVGVAWTGHTATRTTVAIDELGRSEGFDDALAAARKFDLPTQNLVYADADGRTMYYATGKLPIREVDGEAVAGDRIFDGSAGEGEWAGFEPFGRSSWDGFVPFEEKPHAIDPDALSTANQRVIDDPRHYVGVAYATPYRGMRIADRLDDAIESDEPTDPAFHRALQRDVRDGRAAQLVPDLIAAVEAAGERADEDPSDRATAAAEALDDWDYRMDRDSRAALVFARWLDRFRELAFEPTFDAADLGEAYRPSDWVLAALPDDDPIFADRSRPETMVAALEESLAEIAEAGWETYGDWNSTAAITHPLGGEAPFLNYDEIPVDGSRATVMNYRVDDAVGSSWRMVVRPGTDATAVIPGGNSGDYFSEHYDDQLRAWLANDQKPMSLRRPPDADETVAFRGDSS